jgi:outer membrane protein assembly factor BamB
MNETPQSVIHVIAAATLRFTAVFALVVSMLLAMQGYRLKKSDPLDAPELQRLRQELAQAPESGDMAKIRDLDFLYRRAWFAGQSQLRFGIALLGGCGLLALLAMQVAESTRVRPIVRPQGVPDNGAAANRLARRIILAGGALACGGILLWPLVSPQTGTPLAEDRLPQAPTAPSKLDPAAPSVEQQKANWPGFRGFANLGLAGSHRPPLSWNGPTRQNVKWRQEVAAPGFSSPVVWQDKLVLTGGDKDARLVMCHAVDDGRLLWKTQVSVPGSPGSAPEVTEDTGYAAATPATDGNFIFAIFATGDLVCLDFDGRQIWSKNLGVPQNPYGHSSSLLLADNRLIVQYDDENSQVLYAFAPATGEVLWKTLRKSIIGWSSPSCVETSQGPLVVLLTSETVEGFDLKTGRQRWLTTDCMRGEVAPSIAFDKGKIFVANDNACAAAIDPETGKMLWKNEIAVLPDVASPVVVNDLLFLFTSAGLVVCLDATTGKQCWEQEVPETFYSSPIVVEGKILAIDLAGQAIVIDPQRDRYVEVAKNPLGERVMATPACLGNKLFLRGVKHLYCIEASSGATTAEVVQ